MSNYDSQKQRIMNLKKRMMNALRKMFILSLTLCSTSLTLFAKVTLPAIFTDNMVLQQQSDAPIWGKATANKSVKLITSWDKKTYTTQAAADGNWSLKVKTPAASFTPYTVSISDGKAIVLSNILIGEVWICSGQSNMEMPLAGWGKVNHYEQEIAAANYPNIRLLHVSKRTSNLPLYDVKLDNGGWKECSPATISEFSSVAYFFGRDLLQNLNVPIGLINTSWGGTIAEAWASAESVESMPDFTQPVSIVKSSSDAEQEKQYTLKLAEWENKIMSLDRGYKNNIIAWANAKFDDSSWQKMSLPGYWEGKGLINFDGIVWFRKSINIPEKWAGKNLKLSLGNIDDNETTYFNGEKVGATEGWNIGRVYTIPARMVKKGSAVITVRVIDNGGNGGFHGDDATMFLESTDGEKMALSGDWKYEIGGDIKTLPSAPRPATNNPNRPTVLFNAMIHPLVPYSIRGAIWYQGESNESRAYQYRELFPLMINDWRKQWSKEIPFYFVQLANFMEVNANPEESNWAELREAQSKTLNLGNTGMAVTIDIGEAKDIHPKNKQEVGHRLALAARANTYGEKIAFSGPMYNAYKIEGNTIRISFNFTDKGLKINDNQSLKGFAIAGLDHKFHWAQATIDGNEVVVSCPDVAFPIAVRYAWANNPTCNLYNGAGLPASPFRTDDWPGLTFGQK